MLTFVADENFNNRIVRGLLLKNPSIQIIRIQDTHLAEQDDETILDWVCNEGFVLLTQDVKTIPFFAYERLKAGLPLPAVIIASQDLPIGAVIEDLLLIAECSEFVEWEGKVSYLPL